MAAITMFRESMSNRHRNPVETSISGSMTTPTHSSAAPASVGAAARVIHSGHFMISNPHRSDQDTSDEEGSESTFLNLDHFIHSRRQGGPVQIGADGEFVEQQSLRNRPGLRSNLKFTSCVVDQSLNRLFQCLSLAYKDRAMTNPKWDTFKGLKWSMKDKIRLNNIIWREYHRQFVLKKRAVVVQFSFPPLDEVHTKAEACLLEGTYWKRHYESIEKQYHQWRLFFKERLQQASARLGESAAIRFGETCIHNATVDEETARRIDDAEHAQLLEAVGSQRDAAFRFASQPKCPSPTPGARSVNILDDPSMEFEQFFSLIPPISNPDLYQPTLFPFQPNMPIDNMDTELECSLTDFLFGNSQNILPSTSSAPIPVAEAPPVSVPVAGQLLPSMDGEYDLFQTPMITESQPHQSQFGPLPSALPLQQVGYPNVNIPTLTSLRPHPEMRADAGVGKNTDPVGAIQQSQLSMNRVHSDPTQQLVQIRANTGSDSSFGVRGVAQTAADPRFSPATQQSFSMSTMFCDNLDSLQPLRDDSAGARPAPSARTRPPNERSVSVPTYRNNSLLATLLQNKNDGLHSNLSVTASALPNVDAASASSSTTAGSSTGGNQKAATKASSTRKKRSSRVLSQSIDNEVTPPVATSIYSSAIHNQTDVSRTHSNAHQTGQVPLFAPQSRIQFGMETPDRIPQAQQTTFSQPLLSQSQPQPQPQQIIVPGRLIDQMDSNDYRDIRVPRREQRVITSPVANFTDYQQSAPQPRPQLLQQSQLITYEALPKTSNASIIRTGTNESYLQSLAASQNSSQFMLGSPVGQSANQGTYQTGAPQLFIQQPQQQMQLAGRNYQQLGTQNATFLQQGQVMYVRTGADGFSGSGIQRQPNPNHNQLPMADQESNLVSRAGLKTVLSETCLRDMDTDNHQQVAHRELSLNLTTGLELQQQLQQQLTPRASFGLNNSPLPQLPFNTNNVKINVTQNTMTQAHNEARFGLGQQKTGASGSVKQTSSSRHKAPFLEQLLVSSESSNRNQNATAGASEPQSFVKPSAPVFTQSQPQRFVTTAVTPTIGEELRPSRIAAVVTSPSADVKPTVTVLDANDGRSSPRSRNKSNRWSASASVTSSADGNALTNAESVASASDQKRVTHITAEAKRRSHLRNNLQVLQSLIPAFNPTTSGGSPDGSENGAYTPAKVSKAVLLQEAAKYIVRLRAEMRQDEEAIAKEKAAIERCNAEIEAFQRQLPVTGLDLASNAAVNEGTDRTVELWHIHKEARISSRGWKFFVFSLIFEPLLEKYAQNLRGITEDEFNKCVYSWLDQSCGIHTIRQQATSAVRFVCSKTSIAAIPSTSASASTPRNESDLCTSSTSAKVRRDTDSQK